MHKRVRRHRVSGTCPLGRGPSGSREYESKQQRLPPGRSTVLGTNGLARTGGQRARRCHLGAQSCQCCCSPVTPCSFLEVGAGSGGNYELCPFNLVFSSGS